MPKHEGYEGYMRGTGAMHKGGKGKKVEHMMSEKDMAAMMKGKPKGKKGKRKGKRGA